MATENIKKRANQEQQDLEEGIKKSISEVSEKTGSKEIAHDKVTIRETEDNNVMLIYNGKEFQFPKAQPAWVSMFIALHGEGDNKELSDEKSLDFLIKLVGRGLATEIVEAADNDFSIADVAEQIVEPIQSYWSTTEEAPEKKPTPTSTSGS